jgi:hypothetical protein
MKKARPIKRARSLEITIQGCPLIEGVDYVLEGNKITFAHPPFEGTAVWTYRLSVAPNASLVDVTNWNWAADHPKRKARRQKSER